MISLRNFALRRGERLLLSNVDLTLHAGYRVGVVGRNGTGKSSLFAAIQGELEADKGDLDLPGKVRIASVAQETPSLPDPALEFVLGGDEVLAAAVREEADANAREDWEAVAAAHQKLAELNGYDAEARAGRLLHGLGFPAETHRRPVSSFSGGWRVRLNLARALMMPSDLLLLDEPTNHLDLATREALAVALNEFEGTLMLVSHDRALLRSVCDEFWLVARGGVAPFDGDLEDYQRYLLDEAKRLRAAAADQVAADSIAVAAIPESAAAQKPLQEPLNPVNPAEQRRLDAQRRQQLAEKTRPLKRALEKTEQRMQALGAEQATIEQRLATALPPADIAEAGRRLKAVGDELATLEDEWLRLSGEIEAIE